MQLSPQHQEESIVNFTSIALFLVHLNNIIFPWLLQYLQHQEIERTENVEIISYRSCGSEGKEDICPGQDFIGVFNGKFHPAAAIHNAPTPSCSSSPSNRKSPLLIASFPVHLSNIIFLDWTIIVRGHGLDIVEFWFFSWSAQHHQSRLTRP